LDVDRLLLGFDVGVAGALWRAALGALLVPALRAVHPAAGIAFALAVLVAVLFAVKAVAAVARRALPASPQVRAHQEWRRNLARVHDSYQWRKLLWVGLGMFAASTLHGPRARWERPLAAACLGAGLTAELLWRRKRLANAPPLARA
jgi:hypothetical protein